ncbi:CocE/NonD family hydrolase [Nocardioides marmoriginsengisoli]|uniref:CocE/NonD family hydrolase n=1 Tax=Nocardioides marmoriginsengisoli TaxID=661483 RepID=A0A3N0CAB1_9ACTN|nr:CocE/NonD family hydrolase [Nocardioides marmoriginsengisoli]RNL60404.1 CocE/NonD family hydrolase [Nocardioides marmoriginsengisoli]
MRRLHRPATAAVAAGLIAVTALLPLSRVDAADQAKQALRISASDGVSLAATLTGPGPLTARPTVVEFTPYGENGATFTVGPDYNFLTVQVRGTGDSDGSFDVLGPRSQKDVVDALTWACAQPWSNGELAIAGFSASAIIIFNSLHQELPCVKAAVLRSGTFELYRDLLVPGGVPNSVPGLAVLGGIGGLALVQGPQRLARNPSSALGVITGLLSAGFNAGLLHPTLDTYWRERGFRGNVNDIPTLLIDGAFDVEPRGDYQAFQQLRADGGDPHLLVVGGHDGAPRGTDNGVADIARWFDHYVRGVDNGIQNEPAVQMLLANGDREDMLAGDFVRLEGSDWPIPGTTWNELTLSKAKSGKAVSLNDGSLKLGTPDAGTTKQLYPAITSLPTNTDPNTIATIAGGDGGPLNKLADFIPALTNMNLTNLTGLTYTSGPLSQPVTAAGPATLDLRLASLMPTTNIWAVISDVSPDGQAHPMAVGRLNTAFPDVVPGKSLYSAGQLVQPYGDYANPRVGLLGVPRTYHVEFWPIANRFQAGHRIQLSIVGQSALSLPSLPSLNTVTIGGTSGSRLMFPTVPGSDLAAALP